MEMQRRFFFTAALATLFCLTHSPVDAAERLSLSTWGSPKHYQVAEFVPLFERLLQEKTNGSIRLKVFAGGEMVKQQFVATAIPQGTVDISLTTLDTWSGRVPDVGILTTPLWTKSMEWTLNNLRPGNKIFDFYDQKLRDQGAVILTMFDIGPPILSTNFQVTGPASFSNMTVRAYSKGAAEVLQALGASPTIIGVGDVYSALQRGTVKGAMGGLGGAVGLKHYEVTKFTFVPNGVMGTLIHAYVMNKSKFDSLSPDMQKAVLSAAGEARDYMQKYAITKQKDLLDEVRKAGHEVVTVQPNSSLWDSFKKTLEPINKKARESYSSEIVRLVTSD
jgi:TRAP-type C4-dicarboxylate transport system substrate-binding protein